MVSDFVTELQTGDRDAIRCAPKADLRIHGFGGGDRSFVRERTGADIRRLDRVLGSMAEMYGFAEANLLPAFPGLAGRALALEAIFAQSRKDGVTRLEVGEDAWGITRPDGSAEAVWLFLQEAYRAGGPDIDWVPQLGIAIAAWRPSSGGCRPS
jgi:adenosine deaminase